MALKCQACGEELPSGARFCMACGERVPPAVEAPPPAVTDIPPELRAKFEAVRADLKGDRRQVVVLFADLQGFTGLAEQLDAEDLTFLVSGLLQELAAAVYEYEGYVDKFIGDAIMALFGAPLAHEDDPDRAVLAGLAMIERIRRRNEAAEFPLSLRVGIHAGEVVAAHLGDGLRLQYTVVGDAVNVASRLEGRADPNTVLVSAAVHGRVASRFDVDTLEPITVKGRTEPVPVFRIVRAREGPAGWPQSASPFVGRAEELAMVGETLARAGTVVLEGEAGAGKSRLAREGIARAAGATVLDLGFSSVRRPGQRQAEAELFRQLVPGAIAALELLGQDAEEHRAGVLDLARHAGRERPQPPGVDEEPRELEPDQARRRRWRSLAALLRAVTSDRRVILHVEDLHWAEEEARDLLAFLLRATRRIQVAAVMTARPGADLEFLPTDAVRIALAPLDETAARSLVGQDLEALPAPQRRELLRRAAGNPLFLEELSRALREGLASQVPDTVQGLLRARIDRLDPAPKSALQMAAVLGSRFPVALLERMYRLDPQPLGFPEALDALEAGGFLVALDGERRFLHDLLQEVAYAGLLLRIRKVLHESAARLGVELFADRLESEAPFFAHHYWEAGLQTEALPHLWAAGRAAAARYDLPAAERHLRRASETVQDDPSVLTGEGNRAGFCETLGKVLLWRGDLDQADLWFQRLGEEADAAKQPAWRARALELQGRVAWHRGRLDEARALFEAGLDVAPAGEEGLRADLHNALGIVHYYRSDAEQAFAHHDEGLRLRERLGDRLGLSKSYSNIGNLLLRFHQDLAGAEARYRKALELAQEVDDRKMVLSVLHNLAVVARERGDWAEALERYRNVEAMHEEIGWSHVQWMTTLEEAKCEIGLGRLSDALARLDRCVREGDHVLEPVNRLHTRLYLFDAWLCAREDARAGAALVEARRLLEELGVREHEELVLLREGRLLAARGDWETAARKFTEAEDAARRGENPEIVQLTAAHRDRALAHVQGAAAGDLSPPAPDLDSRSTTYAKALIAYLHADAEAVRRISEATADRLTKIADLSASRGWLALERAAAERLAAIHQSLGDPVAAATAQARAHHASDELGRSLPDSAIA